MRLLLWHVHGSWTTAFVQGQHEYFVPVNEKRDHDGLGRARTWDWPASVAEVSAEQARDMTFDAFVLQRPSELHDLAYRWTGKRPGTDVPAVYLEHNAPEGLVNQMAHPAKDRKDVHVVHVTHFNALFWDTGRAPSTVIEHGIVDPGYRYSGELPRAAMVVNEPVRRGRVVGTDLLPRFRERVPVDLFGMKSEPLGGSDLTQAELHDAMARRRAYLHLVRWTSLGLSLIEAMHLGMPVVALATTEVPYAVPPAAGTVSNRLEVLDAALQRYMREPETAVEAGRQGRQAALERYGLKRFLRDWDDLLERVAR